MAAMLTPGRSRRWACRPPSRPSARLPHLWPAVLALLAAGSILAALDGMAGRRIAHRAVCLAALNLPENSRGIALQRQMAARPDSLLMYGSSELSNFQPTRADLFFRRHPAGFWPVVIGQPGDRCLIILQELAALGESARGRKFVVFLSPNWFLAPGNGHARTHLHRQFARDFSPVQTSALLLDGRLDRPLKEEIARRLMDPDHQDTVGEASPLLACALDSLQGNSPWQAVLFWLLRPLLVLQDDAFCREDRWQTAHLAAARHPPSWWLDPGDGRSPDWTGLLRKMDGNLAQSGFATPYSLDLSANPRPEFLAQADPLSLYPHGDGEFLARLDASREWTDLGLLLRTVRQIGAQVLLVGQPFNGAVYDACRVDASTRQRYYGRVAALANTDGVKFGDFARYEEDRSFFSDLLHPSAKAWLYYDREMARFYHAPD